MHLKKMNICCSLPYIPPRELEHISEQSDIFVKQFQSKVEVHSKQLCKQVQTILFIFK